MENNNCDILNINPEVLKRDMKFKENIDATWKASIIKEMTNVKMHQDEVKFSNGLELSKREINHIICDIATS